MGEMRGSGEESDTVEDGLVGGVRKIAVLRANGIGDFVFALPALAALRAAYPGAEITWLGQRWHGEFFSRGPRAPLDRVVVVPPSRGVNGREDAREDAGELDRFFAAMREERFDLAIQLHGGGRHSNPFLRRLGARVTAGSRTPDAPALDRTVPYVYWQPEFLRYLEIVSLVGARGLETEPQLRVFEADLAESRQVVPETRQPIVVLNPGASDPRRRWPAERFAEIGDALAREGLLVVVAGSAEERHLALEITGRMQADAVDASARLSLGGLLGLVARAALVISNDTGPLHLAVAAGTASVGIYWCGNLFTAGPPTRRLHRPLVSWQLACPLCGCDITEAECEHRPSFVARVRVAEVLDAALDLLSTEELRATAP